MALSCQKHLFSFEKNTHYLNCAAYSPFLTTSVQEGIEAMELKSNPQHLTPQSHFKGIKILRTKLGELVNCHRDRIAIIPSASYGMAIVANNLHRIKNIEKKKNILVLQNDFPNNSYAFVRVAQQLNLNIIELTFPSDVPFELSGKVWNENILKAINEDTACLVIPHVHWINGIIFDLESISTRCRLNGALLVMDATQSLGAYPLDVNLIKPDAIVCAAYKWLFGPYSIGFGYFGEFFDDGVPLEESWMNRLGSENFSNLTEYQPNYRPLAQRYNMGEFSQFILSAIWVNGINQILQWKVSRISQYVKTIGHNGIQELKNLGCSLVADEYRSPHLFGVMLPQGVDSTQFYQLLKENRVYISLRAKGLIRISLSVFNEELDLNILVKLLRKMLKKSKSKL